jgi:hypothetical protein
MMLYAFGMIAAAAAILPAIIIAQSAEVLLHCGFDGNITR